MPEAARTLAPRPAALRAAVGASLDPPLPVPPEPAHVHRRLAEAADGSPGAARRLLADGELVGGYLWQAWEPDLTVAGVGRGDVVTHAGVCRRELWLWLMGERTWHEVAALVAGGVLRRAGTGA